VESPGRSGLYVVADKTYFLVGTDTEDVAQAIVSPEGAVRGTGLQVPFEMFDSELVGGAEGHVAFWQSRHGPRLGLPGGQVLDMTKNRVAYPQYDTGVSGVREYQGIRQIITAMFGSGEQSRMAMGDEVATEVIRNGIVLP